MNDRITAGAAAVMGTLVAATAAVRWAVAPTRPAIDEDDLIGPPTAYTTAFDHAPAPICRSFAYCPNCRCTTAGSVNDNGWLCGECLQPATTTTGGQP
ncbi:hypothetical protein [Streptomyces sp. NPDC001492]